MSQNKLQRADAFKVYEWLKIKQPEIEQGKFTKLQLAQAVGEHIGKLVGLSSLEGIMSEIGIEIPRAPKLGGGNKYTVKQEELEARIANIEKQLGIVPNASN